MQDDCFKSTLHLLLEAQDTTLTDTKKNTLLRLILFAFFCFVLFACLFAFLSLSRRSRIDSTHHRHSLFSMLTRISLSTVVSFLV